MCAYYHVATNFIPPKVFAMKNKGSTKQPGVRQGELLPVLRRLSRPAASRFLPVDPPYKDDSFYQIQGFLTHPQ